MDESILNFRGSGKVFFKFLFHFSMKFMSANRIAPDGMPHFAASHLGLFCLPMSHKEDARLIWVKSFRKSCKSSFFHHLTKNIFTVIYQFIKAWCCGVDNEHEFVFYGELANIIF